MNRSGITAALTASLLLFSSLGSPLAAQAPPAEPEPETFQGEIEVREIGIVVAPPEDRSLAGVRPADILVSEEGTARTVLKAEPLRPDSWKVVLYFDRVLAGPDATLDSALTFSRKARELTDLGTVEVVVADPEPRVALAATRDRQGLSSILSDVAADARKDRNQANRGGRETQPVTPDPPTLRRQLDRLTTFLAGRSDAGARALFLIADGFNPAANEREIMSAIDSGAPAPPGTAAAALRESSRVLSAYGWVTYAGSLRESDAARKRRSISDLDRLRVESGGSRHTNSAPPVIYRPPVEQGPRGDEQVVSVFTRPESIPLTALTRPTSGAVLGLEDQLGAIIEGLGRRWRIWFQAPETLDGGLRRVEVRLSSASDPLRAPFWLRSASSEGMAAARGRLLAGGQAVTGGALSLEATREGNGLRLRLPPSGPSTTGPLRISVAFDNASTVQHTVLPGVSLDKAWEHALTIQPPSGAQRAAVVVEDLAGGRWGGTAVDLR
jgi:hypothetical protein